MGLFKSSPQAPPPPDPTAVAQAQTASNIATGTSNAELNRINQYTPQGSLTYQVVGTNPDGTPQYQSTQTYSPEQQQLYDQSTNLSNSLLGTATTGLTALNNSFNTPYQLPGTVQQQVGSAGPIQSSVADAGQVQGGYNTGGQIQTSVPGAGNIQNNLDFSNLAALPGSAQDFAAQTQQAQQAAYSQATSMLDPQYQLQQQQLASSLAAKGVTENSAAYNQAMQQFNLGKTNAYNQAMYSSIGAGNQEEAQLYGQSLSSRQQGVAETTAQGQFANQAQAQLYGQNYQNAAFANTAQSQQNQQNAEQAAFANQAQQQIYGQNYQNAMFGNTAQQQQYNQNLSNATFANQAQAQSAQEYNQQYNEPLQQVQALMGAAGGVSNPQFANYAQANVANTDVAGITQNSYEDQFKNYQQQLTNQNSLFGSIFGLAGNVASAFI